jgi:hypothetical protein
MKNSNNKAVLSVTTGEAADICGVSQQTIIRAVDRGKMPGAFRIPGSRFRKIPIEGLIEFLEINKISKERLISFLKENGISLSRFFLDRQVLIFSAERSLVASQIGVVLESQDFVSTKWVDNWYQAVCCINNCSPALIIIEHTRGLPDTELIVQAVRVYSRIPETTIIALASYSGSNGDDHTKYLYDLGVDTVYAHPEQDPRVEEVLQMIKESIGDRKEV